MNRREFKCSLSSESIGKLQGEIEKYSRDLTKKVDEFRRLLAERMAQDMGGGFATAIADDILSGGARGANVSVTVENTGETITTVIANGEDAIWCEFGAGVYHNGAVGSSPHPLGSELGFVIGSFGEGKGQKTVWGFYDGEELKLTRGTPASMPMYNALQRTIEDIANIAHEVFG